MHRLLIQKIMKKRKMIIINIKMKKKIFLFKNVYLNLLIKNANN